MAETKERIKGQFSIADYAKHYGISKPHAREKLIMLLDERIVLGKVRKPQGRGYVFEFRGQGEKEPHACTL